MTLADWNFYRQTFSLAVAWGKKLGLPVFKNDSPSEVVWRPAVTQTKAQKKIVKDMFAGKKIKL